MNLTDAAELARYRALEVALCPEGMNFSTYIGQLKKKLEKALAPVWDPDLFEEATLGREHRERRTDDKAFP